MSIQYTSSSVVTRRSDNLVINVPFVTLDGHSPYDIYSGLDGQIPFGILWTRWPDSFRYSGLDGQIPFGILWTGCPDSFRYTLDWMARFLSVLWTGWPDLFFRVSPEVTYEMFDGGPICA
jgi:hypothetical protein